MSAGADELDPLIHVPARLRIMVLLAALTDGDALSFTRLQELLELTPGNLITHLRRLEEAGYVSTEKTDRAGVTQTWAAITHHGRGALEIYTKALRGLLGGL